MPKKFSHANPPEPDECRKRAVRMFDDNEINTDKCCDKLPENGHYLSESGRKLRQEDEYCDDFEEVKDSSKRRTAKEYALYLVSVNTYTERKLRDKLASKKVGGVRCYSDGDIDGAVEYLKSFGYINDLRLAQNSLPGLAARMWGRVKICFYLRKNGIDEDTVEALDFSEIDFSFYCKKLLSRHAGQSREKQLRTLYNAGYNADEIREAMSGEDDFS